MMKRLKNKITGKRRKGRDLEYERAEHNIVNENINISELSALSTKCNPLHLSSMPARIKFSTIMRGGWQDLREVYSTVCQNEGAKTILKNSGWHRFLSLDPPNGDRAVIEGLIDRWWDTTNSFHLPLVEITITPLDFVMLTGIPVGRGNPPPFESTIFRNSWDTTKEAYLWLLAAVYGYDEENEECTLDIELRAGGIAVYKIKDWLLSLKNKDTTGLDEHIARLFMMWVTRMIFFPNPSTVVNIGWLSALEDLSVVQDYELVRINPGVWTQHVDATGTLGHTPHTKITAAFRVLCQGVAADATDEYLRIGKTTVL